jgi:pimeloyl-ACP methyl ester carboxylesterase
MADAAKVLLIDNYDSFTYNLAHLFGELGAEVVVRRNDAVTADEAEELAPTHLVISPGPGRPEDAGVSTDVVLRLAGLFPPNDLNIPDTVQRLHWEPARAQELGLPTSYDYGGLRETWLCHLVTVGAREDPEGWRWKIDASMRFGGFGPWRPEWTVTRLPGLGMPFLGVLGSEARRNGLGHAAAPHRTVHPRRRPARAARGVGHFVHIEQPDLVSAMVLDFLGST